MALLDRLLCGHRPRLRDVNHHQTFMVPSMIAECTEGGGVLVSDLMREFIRRINAAAS